MAFTSGQLLRATGADTAESVNSAEALAALGISGTPVPSTRAINTTSPLTGGGALTADLNIQLGTVPITKGGTGQTAQTAAFDALSPLTTKGDVIGHDGTNNTRLAVGTDGQVLTADAASTNGVKWADAAATYTDEEAQDAVGGILGNTSTVNLTYNDGAPSITADVVDASITAAKLATDALLRPIRRCWMGC